jgi:pimeloyl-ACP methyl ester carboxylesterase
MDPAANVLYIARPCQLSRDESRCAPNVVRNGRFADMSYHSVSRVINRVLAPFPKPRLHLVGVGNGGAVAALMAERRQDVASLRTVGGNLDPTGLARYLGYDGADDLIDPMPHAARLAPLPQEHYVGDQDAIVPAFLTANFLTEIGVTYCTTLVRVPGATHDEGWDEVWRANVGTPPICGKKDFKFSSAE